MCGNGALDVGETCDGNCPADISACPASNTACAIATYTGDAASCTAECGIEQVTACVDGDGCCATGCTSETDDDCAAAMCGNDIVENGETCDGDCPVDAAACNDFNSCTTEMISGTQCTRECAYQTISMCVDSDGCCPAGCTMADDNDCGVDLCTTPLSPVTDPSSVVSQLTIADDTCCFDLNGDSQPDNVLQNILGIAGAKDSTNLSLQSNIDSGAFALVLEHAGLTNAVNQSTYTINVLQGAPQCFMTPSPLGENVYTIKPESYDTQMMPLATLPNASITNGTLTTGYGDLPLVIDLNGALLNVPLRDSTLTGMVNTYASGLPDKGIALDSGKIGGVLKLTELYDEINSFTASSCTCFDYADPTDKTLITYTSHSNASCSNNVTTTNCSLDGDIEEACASIQSNLCGSLFLISYLVDTKAGAPGQNCKSNGSCDSVSVGATFSAQGARITK